MHPTKMAAMRTVCAIAQLVTLLTDLALGQSQTFTSADGAQVNYFRQNVGFRQPQMMVMQVRLTPYCVQ